MGPRKWRIVWLSYDFPKGLKLGKFKEYMLGS